MIKRVTPLLLLAAFMCATGTANELSEREKTYVQVMSKYLKSVDARLTRISESPRVEHLTEQEQTDLTAHMVVSKQRVEWIVKAVIHVASGRVQDIAKIEKATKEMIVELNQNLARIQQLLEQ